MKIDPYKHKERYLAWKKAVENGIPGISSENSEIIRKYVTDMELGLNVAKGSAKGARSYVRLNTLRDKLCYFSRQFYEKYNLTCITQINEEQLVKFFAEMRNGIITTPEGKKYLSVDFFAKIFKSFWHWHQKVNKKKGIEIIDLTVDLDTTREKPDWVYLTEDQVKVLAENAKFKYKVLIYFLFDTGIRAPTELLNIKVSDFSANYKELNIREEISKTFGRRIKLMICSELIKQYIKESKLTPEDYLFDIHPSHINQYLKVIAKRLLGNGVSPAGQKYSDLSMYDFRHCSCCYWLPRYKSESALKYRFGWKKSDKIHYYSELLGMKDTISEEDLLVDITKTEIEQKLTRSEKEREILKEKVTMLEKDLQRVMKIAERFEKVVNGV